MEDSDHRLVLGMNMGDGRQTPPGELRTPTEEGQEQRTPVPEAICDGGGDAKTSQRAAEEEEELDPRIQEELEHLNQANEEINRVELQLDEARTTYRRILSESARKLNAQGSQLGNCIEKARPYYEARRLAKEAQQETQKAALRYERAVSMHNAAREMVFVAEQGVMADKNRLDPTWQEMLNHATCKVNEAEEERLRSEREHQRVTRLCQQAEAKVQSLQKSLKRVIVKSKPYFELKAQFNQILEVRPCSASGPAFPKPWGWGRSSVGEQPLGMPKVPSSGLRISKQSWERLLPEAQESCCQQAYARRSSMDSVNGSSIRTSRAPWKAEISEQKLAHAQDMPPFLYKWRLDLHFQRGRER